MWAVFWVGLGFFFIILGLFKRSIEIALISGVPFFIAIPSQTEFFI